MKTSAALTPEMVLASALPMELFVPAGSAVILAASAADTSRPNEPVKVLAWPVERSAIVLVTAKKGSLLAFVNETAVMPSLLGT
jgi:hypothetical protein